MSPFLHRCISFCSTLAAVVILFAAIAITGLRLALPHLPTQRAQIESWTGELIGRPVRIAGIHAEWQGWRPDLKLENVAVLSEDGKAEILKFAEIDADVAPLRSLATHQPVLGRLRMKGVTLTLLRAPDGTFGIAGFPATRSPVLGWLLAQQDVVLDEARVRFIDELRGAAPLQFDGVRVELRAEHGAPRIRGAVTATSVLGRRMSFEISHAADLLGPAWRADLYVAVEGMPVTALAGTFDLPTATLDRGTLDARVSTHWQNGALERVFFDLAGRDVGTAGAAFSAHGNAAHTATGWTLGVDRLAFGGADAPAVDPGLVIAYGAGGDGHSLLLTATRLPLDGVPMLASLLPESRAALRDLLPAIAPRGALEDLRLGYAAHGELAPVYYLSTRVKGFTTNAAGKLPGLDGVDAELRINNQGGALDFLDTSFHLTREGFFLVPIEVRNLGGTIAWQERDHGWRFSLGRIAARIEDIGVRAAGQVDLVSGRAPVVDFALDFEDGDIARVQHFLPLGLMHPHGEHWLRTGFASGRIAEGRLVLRGALDRFPFREGEGEFSADIQLADVDLDYATGWPFATDVEGLVKIRGPALDATLESGKFYQATIKPTTVRIADMFGAKPVLLINGTARAAPADTIKFITNSPLVHGKAARVAELSISRELEIDLNIDIALYTGGKEHVLGKVRLDGNRVHSDRENMTFEDVRGSISFTENDWYGEDLTALYEGEPVTLVVNGGLDDPNYDSEFRMTGSFAAPQVMQELKTFAPFVHQWLTANGRTGAVNGAVGWKAVMTIPQAGSGVAKKLVVESNLQGLAIDLPWPFGKTANEQKLLRIETEISQTPERHTRVAIEDQVRFDIVQGTDSEGGHPVEGARIVFGKGGEDAVPGPGIVVRGTAATLPLDDWALLLAAATSPKSDELAKLPIDFDVTATHLQVLGQDLPDTRVTGGKRAQTWQVALAGPQAAGEITVPRDLDGSALTLNFDKLWLNKLESTGGAQNPLDPRRLPPFVLACRSFRYGTVDLGQTNIVTKRATGGLDLETLVFNNDAFLVEAKGSWLLQGGVQSSQFDIELQGEKLGEVLKVFGYEGAAIAGGRSEFRIQARWLGMPSEFTLDRLDGNLELKVEDGRFLDIEPGSGRLFGLLSLQTLPRRLSLDFSDLFKKGFTFDRIKGHFNLEKGDAYTSSLKMEGPAARIEISGRTGLAAKDYDQHVVVTPAISNTLPLAGAVFGPAGVGVGAALLITQKVFKAVPDPVDKILSKEYSIKGSWDNPRIERL
ncbi:MAG: TIGR02099 family protein [Gammaproteobacteria bacterium]|nr:TIGR02099 family protein [Gammaproteobacteria bacterium]